MRVGLLVSQRDHGVDAHGAARGQISSNQTDRDHYCSGNDNRKRAGDWQVGDQASAECATDSNVPSATGFLD
jgi:hypothetical protein